METILDPDRRLVSEGLLGGWIHMGDDSSSNLGEHCVATFPAMVRDAEYKDCTTFTQSSFSFVMIAYIVTVFFP